MLLLVISLSLFSASDEETVLRDQASQLFNFLEETEFDQSWPHIKFNEGIDAYSHRVKLPCQYKVKISDNESIDFILVPAGISPSYRMENMPSAPAYTSSGIACTIVIASAIFLIVCMPIISRKIRGEAIQFSLLHLLLFVISLSSLFFTFYSYYDTCVKWGLYYQCMERRSSRLKILPSVIFYNKNPFYITKYEITKYQYASICNFSNTDGNISAQRPIDNVTWEQAESFCSKLSLRANCLISLPTVEEWEYCASSDLDIPEEVSNRDLSDIAWYFDNALMPNPVGTKCPNRFGVYDMWGNVAEWCIMAPRAALHADVQLGYDLDSRIGNPLVKSYLLMGGAWYSQPRDLLVFGRETVSFGVHDAGIRLVIRKRSREAQKLRLDQK